MIKTNFEHLVLLAFTFNYNTSMNSSLPDIYLFNPTCEYAIANGNSNWQANRLLQKMEADMAALPLYFAQSKDVILVNDLPSSEFLETISRLKTDMPNFVLKSEINTNVFREQAKNKLLPWGWSPAVHKFLQPLKVSCSEEFQRSPVFNWQLEYRQLYSREFALSILKQLVEELNQESIIPQTCLPKVCRSQPEIEMCLESWGFIMVKAPWSSSGRGLQPISKTPVHPKVWEKLLGIVKEQGFVLVEPLLNKKMDIAFEFELKKGKVRYLGLSNFTTDKKGQYQGNWLGGMPGSTLPEIAKFVNSEINTILQVLIGILERSKLSELYEGFFGVDLLVYSDENKRLKINPCLEINLRYNMGLLALELERFIVSGKQGVFRTFYQPGKTFHQFKGEIEKQHPLHIRDGKIQSGFLPLTYSNGSTLFGGYMLV